MNKNKAIILRWCGLALVVFICLALAAVRWGIIKPTISDPDAPTPLPERSFVPPRVVRPQMVGSTWSFDTIFAPHRFTFPKKGWLAVDSKGHAALAYGGSQFNYTWFDGTTWQSEGIDLSPGAGKYTHLLLDGKDQPHIVYAAGNYLNLSLETMYRDRQGWHRQAIDPGSCVTGNLDAALDDQGNLLVAYEFSPKCGEMNVYTSQIRLAQQTADKFQIETVSETGVFPSLVVDRLGRVHVAFQHVTTNFLVEAVRQDNSNWELFNLVRNVSFPTLPSLLVDTNLYTHVIYSAGDSQNSDSTSLYQNWQDETGWHTEQIAAGVISQTGFSASIDIQGRIYVAFSDGTPRVARRNSNSWQGIGPSNIATGNYSAFSLVSDQQNQLHLAYFVSPQYTIHYGILQDGQWHINQVDQGNEPSIDQAGMAFDQSGKLHITFYDAQQTVHFFSEEPSGWRDEVVARVGSAAFPRPLELLLDLKDLPHIFYENGTPPVEGISSSLVHAYYGATGWVNEGVPVKNAEEYPYRSPVAVSPQGWPAFVQSVYSDSTFDSIYLYRSPNGWETQSLPNIQASQYIVLPKIAFPNLADPSYSDKTGPLPGVFYFDLKANSLKYVAPGEHVPQVVPLLAQDDKPDIISLRLSKPVSPLFFAFYSVNNSNSGTESSLRFANYANGRWQTYQLGGIYEPVTFDPLIDSSGVIHFAYLDYAQPDQPIYYLTGSSAQWKKTRVIDAANSRFGLSLVGSALDSSGRFCLLLADSPANSLVLSCLESLQ